MAVAASNAAVVGSMVFPEDVIVETIKVVARTSISRVMLCNVTNPMTNGTFQFACKVYVHSAETSAVIMEKILRQNNKRRRQLSPVAPRDQDSDLVLDYKTFENDIEIIRLVNGHPNIIDTVSVDPFRCRIYMQYFQTPLAYLEIDPSSLGAFPDECTLDILRGLKYMHANGVIHGDIKPTNILWSESTGCVICDFSHSIILPDKNAKRVLSEEVWCSVEYALPDISLKLSVCARDVDVWSTGLITVLFFNRCKVAPIDDDTDFSDEYRRTLKQDKFVEYHTSIQAHAHKFRGALKHMLSILEDERRDIDELIVMIEQTLEDEGKEDCVQA